MGRGGGKGGRSEEERHGRRGVIGKEEALKGRLGCIYLARIQFQLVDNVPSMEDMPSERLEGASQARFLKHEYVPIPFVYSLQCVVDQVELGLVHVV